MCQAKILLKGEEAHELFLEDVVHLRVDEDTLWLRRLFEEPVPLRGKVLEADFLEHTVTVLPIEEPQGS
jgi:predicted RNA-binding protein